MSNQKKSKGVFALAILLGSVSWACSGGGNSGTAVQGQGSHTAAGNENGGSGGNENSGGTAAVSTGGVKPVGGTAGVGGTQCTENGMDCDTNAECCTAFCNAESLCDNFVPPIGGTGGTLPTGGTSGTGSTGGTLPTGGTSGSGATGGSAGAPAGGLSTGGTSGTGSTGGQPTCYANTHVCDVNTDCCSGYCNLSYRCATYVPPTGGTGGTGGLQTGGTVAGGTGSVATGGKGGSTGGTPTGGTGGQNACTSNGNSCADNLECCSGYCNLSYRCATYVPPTGGTGGTGGTSGTGATGGSAGAPAGGSSTGGTSGTGATGGSAGSSTGGNSGSGGTGGTVETCKANAQSCTTAGQCCSNACYQQVCVNALPSSSFSCGDWTRDESFPTGLDLAYDVWGTSESDIYVAAGTYQTAQIVHWNGTAWAYEPNLPISSYYLTELWTIWGSSTNDVWAGGYYKPTGGTSARPVFMRKQNGGAWILDTAMVNNLPRSSGVRSLWGSNGNVYAAVDVNTTNSSGSRIYRHNGSSWSEMTPPSMAGNFRLMQIWGYSENDVYAVGGKMDASMSWIDAVMWHFDGTVWSDISSEQTTNVDVILGIHGNGFELFAVGANQGSGATMSRRTKASSWQTTTNNDSSVAVRALTVEPLAALLVGSSSAVTSGGRWMTFSQGEWSAGQPVDEAKVQDIRGLTNIGSMYYIATDAPPGGLAGVYRNHCQ